MSKKIKAILVDDEYHAIENMQILLTAYFPQIDIVGEASKLLKAAKLISQLKPDVVFLDVSMPDGTGFDLLNVLENRNFKVVFVTAFEEYAINAIKEHAFDYILKPIQLEELKRCISKLEKHFNSEEILDIPKRISISTLESMEFINTEDIIYCKSDNSYTTICLKNGHSLLASKSLKNIQNLLPETSFKRSHNSYLVNKTYVKRYLKKDESIELVSGIQIPLSKSKKEEILNWLKN